MDLFLLISTKTTLGNEASPIINWAYSIYIDFTLPMENTISKQYGLIVFPVVCAHNSILRLRNAFIAMDTDGSGFITKENLKELVAEQGAEQLSDEDADKLIASVDSTGDGKVSFAEFVEAAATYIEEKIKEKEGK